VTPNAQSRTQTRRREFQREPRCRSAGAVTGGRRCVTLRRRGTVRTNRIPSPRLVAIDPNQPPDAIFQKHPISEILPSYERTFETARRLSRSRARLALGRRTSIEAMLRCKHCIRNSLATPCATSPGCWPPQAAADSNDHENAKQQFGSKPQRRTMNAAKSGVADFAFYPRSCCTRRTLKPLAALAMAGRKDRNVCGRRTRTPPMPWRTLTEGDR